MVERGELLEWAAFAGYSYGTPRAAGRGAPRGRRARSCWRSSSQGARQVRAVDARRPAGLPGAARRGRSSSSAWSAAGPRTADVIDRRLDAGQDRARGRERVRRRRWSTTTSRTSAPDW